MPIAWINAQVTPENCSEMSAVQGWPSYYCDCKFNYLDFSLPLDIEISDSTWFKASLSDLSQGLSAYLYSDCDMSFDVYIACTAQEPKYQAIFTRNQTNSINAQTIKEKLEEYGYGDGDATFYICIAPIYGFGGRLLVNTINQAFSSTCDDPLHLFPGMTMLSQATNDVYVVDPNDIPYGEDVVIQWVGDNNAPCHLSVTRGACNATPFVEYTFNDANDRFVLSAELIDEAWGTEEFFYLHFSHDVTATGTIHCLKSDYQVSITDTTICQGKVFRYEDILATESGLYYYDTIQTSLTSYQIYGYNVTFVAPELQRDTLSLRTNQLPYNYRGQTISDFGDYDILLQTPSECDEHIALHVLHNLTTIHMVVDTTLCQGNIYEADGKKYMNDVTLVDSLWQGRDTLYVARTNVSFSAMDVVYDTLAVKNTELEKGVRLYNKYKVSETVRAFGDYKYIMRDAHNCPDSLYLHVCHNLTVVRDTVEKIFCEGTIYEHNGVEYTSSVTLVDTVFSADGDTQTITTTQALFVTNEIHYDTLYLKTTDLPYTYRGVALKTFGEHQLSFDYGDCDQQVQLTIFHDIDTLMQSLDTTSCQGKVFTYKGQDITTDIAFLDTAMYNADTCIITSVSATFTAPEAIPDTLALKQAALPYLYRGQKTITAFGDYDLTFHTSGECDERYLLHVYHQVDTLTQTIDTVLCQGRIYVYSKELLIQSDTIFLDSIQLNADTFCITSVNVQFTEPETQNETLYLKTTDLPYTYRHQCVIPEGGLDKDYDVLIHTADECDERYLLHVYHKIDTLRHTVDTMLCQGKFFEYEGKQYTSDTTFMQKLRLDDDTYQITTINLSFLEPEQQHISLPLKYSNLPYTYCGLTDTITAFGDYALTIHTPGECDERHLVHAYHKMDTIRQIVDSAVCGIDFTYEGKSYTEDKTFITYLPYNQDTIIANVLNVYFTSEKVDRYQTLILKPSQLPYTYNLPDFSTWKITHFGDFDREYTNFTTWCDEHLHLHVQPLIDTLYQSIDTTFCQGAIYPYRNTLTITSDTTFADTLQRDADTYVITSVSVTFAAPEAIPDTLALKQAALPYTYRGQENITDFGDYDLTIRTSGECDERYLLNVYHAIDTLYETISETLCQGKSFTYNGVTYTSSTTFADTLQRDADTYIITSVSVTFTAPEAIPDTLALKQAALPYTYRGQETITAFGDYDLTIRTSGECDERYLLHVYHTIDTLYETVSETLCQGKVFIYNGVEYTSSTTFADTLQRDADTYVITSVSLTFTAPEAIPDTLALKQAALPYTYRGQETITDFGDYDLTIRTAGECDERYLLHVYHTIDTLYESVSETLCQGKSFTYNGVTYTSSTTFADTLQRDADTYIITSVSLTFTAPEAIPDTLALKQAALPYLYRGQETINAFGDYDLTIRTFGECDERYLLHVYHDIDTLYTNIDTTLCEGRIFIHNELEYTQPAILLDSNWLNMDTWQITAIDIAFTTPDMEYDTIVVKTEELLAGYYYEPADTMVYAAGDYFYEILTYNDCTRHLTLTVNEELTSAVDNLPCTEQPRLIMRNGVVYIIRGKECFTILGMKIDNNKITTDIE